MGRSPCCEKVGLKKGPWTPEEDQKLLAYIEENGHGSWRALPAKAGLQRCGKSCRLRWTNYLRPDIKRGKFSMQEEQTIIQLHALLGNRWSAIATHLPKRTDNEIKNYWNTHLKKRLAKMGIDPITHKPKSDTLNPADSQSSSKSTAANLSHIAQWESARLEAEARLVRESKLRASASVAVPTTAPTSTNMMMGATSTNSSSSATTPVTTLDPTHHQLAPTSVPQSPPCLDVFQAWQGVWSSNSRQLVAAAAFNTGPTASQGITRTDLDSPTSTIGVAENILPNALNLGLLNNVINRHEACDAEDTIDWKYLQGKQHQQQCVAPESGEIRMVNYTPMTEPSWPLLESTNIRRAGTEYGAAGFTGLLLLDYADAGDQNSNKDEEAEEQNISSCGDSGGSCVEGGENKAEGEENKNYWNNILNLVNSSSPSNSAPVF